MGFGSQAGMLFRQRRFVVVVFVVMNDEGGVDVGFGQGRPSPARRVERWIHGEERWCSAIDGAFGADENESILDGL